MTVEPHKGNLPAAMGDLETGLDDFGIEDAVIPRLTIQHREGRFKDSLSGEEMDSVKVILLGLVKQRVLWHTELDDGDKPMCKSPDFQWGFPNYDDENVTAKKRFPMEKAGFDPNDFPVEASGFRKLPCEGCHLKEWGSHPDGKKPYCAEQYTLPLLYEDGDNLVPALLSLQKTSLKPIRQYLSTFQRSRTAPYVVWTEISLDLQHKGNNPYSVAKLRKIGDTEQTDWREYSNSYVQLRAFLQQHPVASDDEDGDVEPQSSDDNENKPPASQPEAKAPEKEPVPAAATSGPPAQDAGDDDDLPF